MGPAHAVTLWPCCLSRVWWSPFCDPYHMDKLCGSPVHSDALIFPGLLPSYLPRFVSYSSSETTSFDRGFATRTSHAPGLSAAHASSAITTHQPQLKVSCLVGPQRLASCLFLDCRLLGPGKPMSCMQAIQLFNLIFLLNSSFGKGTDPFWVFPCWNMPSLKNTESSYILQLLFYQGLTTGRCDCAWFRIL